MEIMSEKHNHRILENFNIKIFQEGQLCPFSIKILIPKYISLQNTIQFSTIMQ